MNIELQCFRDVLSCLLQASWMRVFMSFLICLRSGSNPWISCGRSLTQEMIDALANVTQVQFLQTSLHEDHMQDPSCSALKPQ